VSGTIVAVLGAGRAERFGGGKLDAPLAGRALGAWAIRRAQALGHPCLFVASATLPAFLADLSAPPEIAHNPAAATGMGSSLALAARIARERGAARLLVLLADMPLVEEATLRALREATAPGGSAAAACRYPDGRLGPPACFGAALLPRLEGLEGDHGARRLLASLQDVVAIPAGADELLDIDSPADLASAASLLGG